MSVELVNKVLGWAAGILAALLLTAVIALLNTWADVREMKGDLLEQKAALSAQVKAERIATLEVRVDELVKECEHGPLWDAIRRTRER